MALIFDLGGVVFRWQPARLLQTAWPQRAADARVADEWARRFFQPHDYSGDWAAFDRGVLGLPELVQRQADRLDLTLADVRQVFDAIPAHLQLLPDSVALLRRLHGEGHHLYYLSNMPAPLIAHVDPLLRGLGVFEDGIYSADVKLVKPEPAIFRCALERFGLGAGRCVYFDDSPDNVAAARALGIGSWLFVDAAGAARDLSQSAPP